MSPAFLCLKDEPDPSPRSPRKGPERRVGALAVVLEPCCCVAQNEPVVSTSCFSHNCAPGGPGRSAGMAGSWRFCGHQEDPRPVVSGAERQKATAQGRCLDCVEQATTNLQGRRTRIVDSVEMRPRTFLCWGPWEDYAREFSGD